MAHNHVNEYQIRIADEDGTEKLTRWMNSEEQLAQAMATVHKSHGETCWLRVRNVLCIDCLDQDQQIIVECPITGIPSPRYDPHNYLLVLIQVNSEEQLAQAMATVHKSHGETC